MANTNIGNPIPQLEGFHYDIGVFGMWFGENYGSVLTYYALRKALMDLGYSVLMLDKPVFGKDADAEFDPNIHPRVFAREEGYDVSPALKVSDFQSLNRYCDTFIVGSDQVWNFKIARYFRFLSYLPFVSEGNKRISYASSYGHDSSLTPIEELSRIARYMNDFDAVSVRELNGVTITRDEFGVSATQVVDPIYLHDRSIYESLMQVPDADILPEKGYMLCYVLDPSPKIGNIIKDTAKQRGLRPVIMLDGRGNLDEARKRLGISEAFRCPNARQWLYFISHADYMITDSFHGACFSLLFHTQVAILANTRGTARINSLVNTYNIPFIFAHNTEELRGILESKKEIDFRAFDTVLEIEKTRSKKWLKEALEQKPRDKRTINCVTHKECCGCGACYSACPVNAITMEPDNEGFLYPSIDAETCIYCEACKKACPSLNPQYEKSAKPLCFAAYTNDEVREKSSSGGMFSLIARQVLERNGRVCGAAFDDDFTLWQTWAASEEELEPLRMSKYMQSFTGDSYKETKRYLDEGLPVLYVGCPCQVAGLNSFLRKHYDNLITVDLLCHGGPSQKVFKRYLDEVHSGKQITHVGFRDKDYFGWSHEMTVIYGDGDIYRQRCADDLYYRAFTPCVSMRPHCQICNYSKLPRQGDITLGDFWGVSKFDPSFTDGRGTSIVSVNSQQGLKTIHDLWDSLSLFETIPRKHILTHGQPYGRPYRNNPLRTRFFRMLEDTPMATAVECSTSNVFDFCLLDAHSETHGAILRAFSLQKTLMESGHSALVACRPMEQTRISNISPFRLDEFARDFIPALSAHRTKEAQQEFKHYCRGFVADSTRIDYSLSAIVGEKNVTAYSELPNASGINPILLLGQAQIEGLIDNECSYEKGSVAIALSSSFEQGFESQFDSFDGELIDLTKDMSLCEWLSKIHHSSLIVSDDYDSICTAVVLGTPVALWESAESAAIRNQLEACGIYAPTIRCMQDVDALVHTETEHAIDQAVLQNKVSAARTEFVAAAEAVMGDPVPKPEKQPEKKSSESGKANNKKRSLFSKGVRSLKKNGALTTAKKTIAYVRKQSKRTRNS